MTPELIKLINQLARQAAKLKPPVHILAICSGGRTVAQYISKYLRRRGVECTCHEVWTNIVNGRAKIRKADFKRDNYVGTALVVEDVVWKGTNLLPVKAMLKQMRPKKKFYIASILDCNHKADFAVFR